MMGQITDVTTNDAPCLPSTPLPATSTSPAATPQFQLVRWAVAIARVAVPPFVAPCSSCSDFPRARRRVCFRHAKLVRPCPRPVSCLENRIQLWPKSYNQKRGLGTRAAGSVSHSCHVVRANIGCNYVCVLSESPDCITHVLNSRRVKEPSCFGWDWVYVVSGSECVSVCWMNLLFGLRHCCFQSRYIIENRWQYR